MVSNAKTQECLNHLWSRIEKLNQEQHSLKRERQLEKTMGWILSIYGCGRMMHINGKWKYNGY